MVLQGRGVGGAVKVVGDSISSWSPLLLTGMLTLLSAYQMTYTLQHSLETLEGKVELCTPDSSMIAPGQLAVSIAAST